MWVFVFAQGFPKVLQFFLEELWSGANCLALWVSVPVMERELSAWGVTKISRKGMAPFSWLPSTVNLIARSVLFDMVKKCLFMSLLLDDPSIIHKPKPIPGWVGDRLESFSLKMFYIQIGNYGAYWRPHCHSFNLLMEFILKRKVSVMHTEPQKFNDVLYW